MKKLIATFLVFTLTLAASYSQSTGDNSVKSITKTFTYKTVGKTQITIDLYRNADHSSLKPVVVWIHGGALIFGSKTGIPEEQLNFYLASGYSVVSPDYRLAPETKLPAIVEDVRDAVRWVHKNGKDSLGIDPNRIFVIGHSGGGYLALICGYSSEIKPRAIVSFYGYGDIISTWYSEPSPFYLTRPLISKESAEKLISDSVLTSAPFDKRVELYRYTRQQGNWCQLVAGHDPKAEAEWFKRFCPVQNIDRSYPPVLLIHGDKDTDVPFEQSVRLKEKLEAKGVKNKLIRMKNYDHVFDLVNGGLSNPDVSKAFNEVKMFLDQYK